MSTLASPTAECAESKTNLTPEITATEEAEARKERSVSQPSLEPSLNHFEPTASIISEEDACGKKPADQTAETAATGTLEKNSQSEKIEASSGADAGSGAVDDSTAKDSDVQLDSESEEKAENEEQDQVSCEEELGDEDSQDSHHSGDESDELLYPMDRQHVG